MEGPTQAEVDAIQWWHPFVFPNGVTARGRKSEEVVRAEALAAFKYPVHGKTVLDVGAWNGYFSLEAVRRGAKRVVALDKPAWERGGAWESGGFEGFELVRRYLAPSIEPIKRDVMDLRSQPIGQFDCVLFMGVLYHLKHPLYVLESLFDLTREHLVLETHLDMTDDPRPVMVFYPGAELASDPTNWWGPNIQCVIDMLRTVGFSRIEYISHPLYDRRAFFYAFRGPPVGTAKPHRHRFSAGDLPSALGRCPDGVERVATPGTDQPGCLTYGPYLRLAAGSYRVAIRYASPAPEARRVGAWDVCVGTHVIHRAPLPGTGGGARECGGEFLLSPEHAQFPIELRTYFNGAAELHIHEIEVERTIGKEISAP